LARLTRQQLKKDEFTTSLAALQEWFLQNQKSIASTGGLTLLAAAVAIGGIALVRSRQNRASQAFTEALTAYHAPVLATPPPNFNQLYFKTESEKYQDAAKKFYEVGSRYSWSSQGRFARYYAALCQRDIGNLAEAEKELKSVAGGRGADVTSLAKMALAGVYQQSGRNDEAEKLYREIEDHPTNALPKATAELALAELYRRTKPAQAKTLYQQIQKEYPGSAAGDEASKMLLDEGQ
jgi:predicted negative regulator of RcsB-dependent stress response